jgi:hypothetical protein
LALTLAVSTGWAGQERQERARKANVELPAAVAQAVKANVPNAEIATAEVEKEAGINLYDIEFKAGKGEIEVAEDGTVMDVATIIAMKDLPKAAGEAILKAAPGATIKQLEKSEVRAEIKKEGEMVIEALKWSGEKEEKAEAEEKEEEEEARPAAVDLKILPPAVLTAFKTAYPHAVIKGTSKETEKGVTYYEVESVDGQLNRDLLYTADGKAAEIEEAMAPADLPAAVRQTLDKEYPGAKILKAEKMTKGDQKLFELQIQLKDKKKGVMIDPNGKIIE